MLEIVADVSIDGLSVFVNDFVCVLLLVAVLVGG